MYISYNQEEYYHCRCYNNDTDKSYYNYYQYDYHFYYHHCFIFIPLSNFNEENI